MREDLSRNMQSISDNPQSPSTTFPGIPHPGESCRSNGSAILQPMTLVLPPATGSRGWWEPRPQSSTSKDRLTAGSASVVSTVEGRIDKPAARSLSTDDRCDRDGDCHGRRSGGPGP